MRRAALIATLFLIAPAGAGEVRVIGPDSEHVYSSDVQMRGVILDDAELREKNERAEQARRQREIEQLRIDMIRRQEAAEREYYRAKAEAEQAAANAYEEMQRRAYRHR